MEIELIFALTAGREKTSLYFAFVKWVNFNRITSIFYVHKNDEKGLKSHGL